jgi:hypothetical protein
MSDPVFLDVTEDMGLWLAGDAGTASIGSFITGAVTRADSAPGPHKVLVYSRNGWSKGPIAVVESDVNGEWQFDGLKAGNYYMAMIQDRTRELNSAVLDWMTAVELGGS